jgi:REP element-mobilizing transposase RayT
MEGTMAYLRVWIHLVWSTKNRKPLLQNRQIRQQMFAHITDRAREKGIRLDCVNGWTDHAHALISLGPDQTIAKTAQLLKGESSHWANDQRVIPYKFEWQDDYYAVSVSDSAVQTVRRYIREQEEHHRRKSFTEESEEFLKTYGFPALPAETEG